ncbi:MAG TPA: hypothetical protein VJ645_06215 [Gaiellaceae bacterium]|nr:hypothetical protein [Gaiellaceae bacterium]
MPASWPACGCVQGSAVAGRDALAQEGYDPEYGAPPLRLSRLVLGGTVEPRDRVMVEVEDGKLRFDVEKGVFERASEDEAAREEVGAGVGE